MKTYEMEIANRKKELFGRLAMTLNELGELLATEVLLKKSFEVLSGGGRRTIEKDIKDIFGSVIRLPQTEPIRSPARKPAIVARTGKVTGRKRRKGRPRLIDFGFRPGTKTLRVVQALESVQLTYEELKRTAMVDIGMTDGSFGSCIFRLTKGKMIEKTQDGKFRLSNKGQIALTKTP